MKVIKEAKYELHVRYPNGESGYVIIPTRKVERPTARAMEKAINYRAEVTGYTSIPAKVEEDNN